MGSPLRVESFSDLDRNEDSPRTFPRVLVPSLRDGVTLIRSCCVRDRVTLRVECGFSSHSFRTKSSLDSWSVFLQDGVTLFGSGSYDLISSEGIPRVELMGAYFPGRPRDEFRHPLVAWSALKSERVPHSDVVASGEGSVCTPLANERVGLDPSSSSGPVASRPPLVDRSASAASR